MLNYWRLWIKPTSPDQESWVLARSYQQRGLPFDIASFKHRPDCYDNKILIDPYLEKGYTCRRHHHHHHHLMIQNIYISTYSHISISVSIYTYIYNVGYRLVWGYRNVSTDSKIILYLWKWSRGTVLCPQDFGLSFFSFFCFLVFNCFLFLFLIKIKYFLFLI